jgi:uncharacterized membrane protein
MSRTDQPQMAAPSAARSISCWILGLFFIAAGANHFRMPATYMGMLPPALPAPSALIAISGGFEILGGVGILIPRLREAAGWGLIALLVAVFPANLYVAVIGHMPGFNFSPATLWIRLPLQAIPVAWVYWAALAGRRKAGPGEGAAPKPS